MKVALVFPPFHHPSLYSLPPLGLINLGTVAQQAGHQAVVIDQILGLRCGTFAMGPGLYQACAEQIAAERPDVVAFGAQCTTYPPTLRIAEEVRRLRPEARIVIGGHNASFVAAETLARFPAVDAVVRGEGEETFRQLLAAYAAGLRPQTVAGVSWRDGGRIVANSERELIADLDELPLPDYRLAPPSPPIGAPSHSIAPSPFSKWGGAAPTVASIAPSRPCGAGAAAPIPSVACCAK